MMKRRVHLSNTKKLSNGQYETVVKEIQNTKGRDVFTQEIRDVFSRTGEITNSALFITELFPDTVITTNYDRLIEQAFDTGAENSFQVINGMNVLEELDVNQVSIMQIAWGHKRPRKMYPQ